MAPNERTPGACASLHTPPEPRSSWGEGCQLDCTHFDGPCLNPARNAATRSKAVPRSVLPLTGRDQHGDRFVEVTRRQRRREARRPRTGEALGAASGLVGADALAELVLHRRRPRRRHEHAAAEVADVVVHVLHRRGVVVHCVRRRVVGDGVGEDTAVARRRRCVAPPAETVGAVSFVDCDVQYSSRLLVTVGTSSSSEMSPSLAWSA